MYSLLYGLYEVLNKKKYTNYTSVELTFLCHYENQPHQVTTNDIFIILCLCKQQSQSCDSPKPFHFTLNTDLNVFSETWSLHQKTLSVRVNFKLRHQKEASGF